MEPHQHRVTHSRFDDGVDKPYTTFLYRETPDTSQQPAGYVHTYDHDATRLHIDDITVATEHRNRGIGRALLTAVKEYAHKDDVEYRHVTATIVSRECLQAMRRVFGHDAISVRKEGDFNSNHPRSDTSASLHYQVQRPDQ